MNRRDLLQGGALAISAVSLSGCTERVLEESESQPPLFRDVYHADDLELPTRQKHEIAAEGASMADETTVESTDDLEAFLDEQGLLVESVEETVVKGEERLELKYVDEAVTARGLLYSLGRVSGGYAALVETEPPGEKLEASLHHPDDGKFGTYDVETSWAEAFVADEISATSYAKAVVHTAKTRR